MNESPLAPMKTWLATPMDQDVSEAPDIQQIAVMPDVHLGSDVCIGVAVATSQLIYPQAVGGDIGCGMLAVALDVETTALDSPQVAGQILAGAPAPTVPVGRPLGRRLVAFKSRLR